MFALFAKVVTRFVDVVWGAFNHLEAYGGTSESHLRRVRILGRCVIRHRGKFLYLLYGLCLAGAFLASRYIDVSIGCETLGNLIGTPPINYFSAIIMHFLTSRHFNLSLGGETLGALSVRQKLLYRSNYSLSRELFIF